MGVANLNRALRSEQKAAKRAETLAEAESAAKFGCIDLEREIAAWMDSNDVTRLSLGVALGLSAGQWFVTLTRSRSWLDWMGGPAVAVWDFNGVNSRGTVKLKILSAILGHL